MTSKKAVPTTAASRLRQDFNRLMKDPVPYIVAQPLPSNILEWHYVVAGPENSLYEGGYFHGKLVFPGDYPFKPPSIYMTTPNGRFKTNTRLCLSISDFHPDTWNPAWSVSTILTGLLSFMLEDSPTFGSITTSTETKKHLAYDSLTYNLADKTFLELFPDLTTDIKDELAAREAEKRQQEVEVSVTSPSCPSIAAAATGANRLEYNRQIIRSTVNNVVVLLGVAAFAYAVKYVLKSLTED